LLCFFQYISHVSCASKVFTYFKSFEGNCGSSGEIGRVEITTFFTRMQSMENVFHAQTSVIWVTIERRKKHLLLGADHYIYRQQQQRAEALD
jgi:hypothetical protein